MTLKSKIVSHYNKITSFLRNIKCSSLHSLYPQSAVEQERSCLNHQSNFNATTTQQLLVVYRKRIYFLQTVYITSKVI
jgi:hypothetical protein